jgi:hypothetical protein
MTTGGKGARLDGCNSETSRPNFSMPQPQKDIGITQSQAFRMIKVDRFSNKNKRLQSFGIILKAEWVSHLTKKSDLILTT